MKQIFYTFSVFLMATTVGADANNFQLKNTWRCTCSAGNISSGKISIE